VIQFEQNGVTLFYFDANGNKISHTYTEGTAYSDMVNIRSDQLQAVAQNALAVTNYNNTLANVQTNVDAGRPHDAAPAKPLQKNVSDTGDVTYTPFVPPLADLVIPVTVPSGSIAAPTLDKQAILYNMVLAIFRKMFPDA